MNTFIVIVTLRWYLHGRPQKNLHAGGGITNPLLHLSSSHSTNSSLSVILLFSYNSHI